jgi:hypothetical protein
MYQLSDNISVHEISFILIIADETVAYTHCITYMINAFLLLSGFCLIALIGNYSV